MALQKKSCIQRKKIANLELKNIKMKKAIHIHIYITKQEKQHGVTNQIRSSYTFHLKIYEYSNI